METVRIKCDERYPVPQSVQAQWHERSLGTMVGLIAEAQLRGLSQEFLVYGRIPHRDVDLDRLARMTRTRVWEAFARSKITNLFRIADLLVESTTPETQESVVALQIEGLTASSWEEQALRGNAAVLCLHKNLQEMRRMVASLALLDAATRSKLQHYLAQLQKYRETMALGAKAAWCAEKYPRLQSALAELGRLRDPTDPQCRQHIANIRQWLQEWPVVNRWHSEPPTG